MRGMLRTLDTRLLVPELLHEHIVIIAELEDLHRRAMQIRGQDDFG